MASELVVVSTPCMVVFVSGTVEGIVTSETVILSTPGMVVVV